MPTRGQAIGCAALALLAAPSAACGAAAAHPAVVVHTWPWHDAASRAWATFANGSAIDALVAGCSVCEREQCDGSVGWGGSPDERGETTLDALVFDGNTMNAGAVADLRNVRDAAQAARFVLERTSHTLLAGDQATRFAYEMGLKKATLESNKSQAMWSAWEAADCQPNYRENVLPDPTQSCGPYKPAPAAADDGVSLSAVAAARSSRERGVGPGSHDTIAMVTIDGKGGVAAGTSTNGADHKVPGRVGDAPVPGAGAYADAEVGGCGATGDGDQMMRLLPTHLGVELMRQGASPGDAAKAGVERVAKFYPDFWGAIVCVNVRGEHGGAANYNTAFKYTVVSEATGGVPVTVNVTSTAKLVSPRSEAQASPRRARNA